APREAGPGGPRPHDPAEVREVVPGRTPRGDLHGSAVGDSPRSGRGGARGEASRRRGGGRRQRNGQDDGGRGHRPDGSRSASRRAHATAPFGDCGLPSLIPGSACSRNTTNPEDPVPTAGN